MADFTEEKVGILLFVKLIGDIIPKILFLLIWGCMIFSVSLFTFVDKKAKLSVRPLSRRHVYIGERFLKGMEARFIEKSRVMCSDPCEEK